MNDAELDKKLKTGRGQARTFFGGKFDIRKSKGAIGWRDRSRFRRIGWKPCLAGAVMVVTAAVCAVMILNTSYPSKTPAYSSADFGEQTIYLNEDKAYHMNAVPVNMPDDHTGLMTMLWEIQGGDEQMAYYSLFEACDTVYPALTIPFPESEYDMVLIASGDSKQNSLGYRLVGYNGDSLTTWWSEDRVPEGSVTLSNGVVVKRHTRENEDRETVTYIIPVQNVSSGRIVMPVGNLHICVGENILLIGADGVDATIQSGLLDAEKHEASGVSAVLLKALGTGRDMVSVGTDEDAKTLSVDIGE